MTETASTMRTTDPAQAQRYLDRFRIPHRLEVLGAPDRFDMELTAARFGVVTAGRLCFGTEVRLTSTDDNDFRVAMALVGSMRSRSGAAGPVRVDAGQGAVFAPGERAESHWSADCVQLFLVVPRVDLEIALGRLLRRDVVDRLDFGFELGPEDGPGRLFRSGLALVRSELEDPAASHRFVARHIETMVIDGLLLAQPHNYSTQAAEAGRSGPMTAVARAVELMEEQPADPWTVADLAAAVHLSIRSLQDGFRREQGVPPMTYLRRVRLGRARERLLRSGRDTTTVRAVALSLGFSHPGRFSALYRDSFGESPSETLARETR